MNKEIVNDALRQHYDEMNKVGLGAMLIFSNGIERYIENEVRERRLRNIVLKICGGSFDVTAREFVKRITYEDFKKRQGVSEIMALGFKLYLFDQFGVDWLHPENKVIAF